MLLRQRAAALVAAVVALVLVATVAPRALGGPSSPSGDPGPTLRVLTANTRYGTASAESIVALVRSTRADVLSLQELTPGLVRRLDAAGLGELMPHYVLAAQEGAIGTGLYSRVALDEAPGPLGTDSSMVAARLRLRGAPEVELVAVHPIAPMRGLIGKWRRDLRALPPAGGSTLRILPGDFNATLDHAELRRLLDTGYEDAAAQVGEGLKPDVAARAADPAARDDRPRARGRALRRPRGVGPHDSGDRPPRGVRRTAAAEGALTPQASWGGSVSVGSSSARIE